MKKGIRNFPLRTRARKFCRVLPSKGRAPHTNTYNTTPKLCEKDTAENKTVRVGGFSYAGVSSSGILPFFLDIFSPLCYTQLGPSAYLAVYSPIYLLWVRRTPCPQRALVRRREGCRTTSSTAGLEKTGCWSQNLTERGGGREGGGLVDLILSLSSTV